MAETRDSVEETQRQTRVSVSGYITVSHVSVAALRLQRNRNTFLHVSDRFPFQESRICKLFTIKMSKLVCRQKY